MHNESFSSKLRVLSERYYHQLLGFERYRAERRDIINDIEKCYNDIEAEKTRGDGGHRLTINDDITQ